MDLSKFTANKNEKPLDNMAVNGGFCGIFRKIACIGDSLSSGEFESFENGNRGYHDHYDYSWGQFLARDTGSEVLNLSRGGLRSSTFFDMAREQSFFEDKYKCRAYIIALGVNDITGFIDGDFELGSTADIDLADCAKNKPTFAGYYAKIIAKYQEMQPKAKFFLMTIPRHTNDAAREEWGDKHAKLIYELADMFVNCYVLDFRKYAPVYDEEFYRNFFLAGHMNAAGYRLTALMVESYIDYIIRNNPEDFAQIGFVGTPYHNSEFKW